MSANDIIRSTFGGRTFRASRRTFAHLEATQAALGNDGTIVVLQGCYNTGVAASAGTHDYDAVVDVHIPGWDWWKQQDFFRRHGWAAWYRHTGTWAARRRWHIHMVSLGYTTPVGEFVPGQVRDYYNHSLGLKGQHSSGLDHSWFPPNIAATVFDYEEDSPMTPAEKKHVDALEKRLAKVEDQLTGGNGIMTVGGKKLNVLTALKRVVR